MDDYMREMMDLKTLVTKTLEKKGVLARIRAELRANVFAAIEEQDRASEGEDGPLALLGSCNERSKKLHSTATGKLLSSLVYEYLEWCELEHTAKVYLPECNLSKGHSRSELEGKLGIKLDEEAGKDTETRPLLLEVLESFLKNGKPALRSTTPVSARTRTVSLSSKPGVADVDTLRDLDKPGSSLREGASDSSTMSGVSRSANRAASSGEPALLNDSSMDSQKIAGRSSMSLLGNLPPLRRSGGLTPIGTSRGNSTSLASSNSSDSAPSVTSRDGPSASFTRKEESIQSSLDKVGAHQSSEQGRVGKDTEISANLSQSKFAASQDTSGMHDSSCLDEDSAPEDNSSRHSNSSSHQVSSRRRDQGSGDTGETRSLSAASSLRKKAAAYVYGDSEDDVSLEGVEEELIEEVDVHREKLSSNK